jgi:hypothetical protein
MSIMIKPIQEQQNKQRLNCILFELIHTYITYIALSKYVFYQKEKYVTICYSKTGIIQSCLLQTM